MQALLCSSTGSQGQMKGVVVGWLKIHVCVWGTVLAVNRPRGERARPLGLVAIQGLHLCRQP